MDNQYQPVPFAPRLLSYLICALIAGQPVLPAIAASVPASNATQMDKAGNGVPVVNIATPNGAGISHNKFVDYSVGKEGIILNNATGQLNPTQLGGLIQNNPNLKAGQEARGIINEVTGANRSQLQGYTEVAGKAANVIVANPYGITCNGCGFINTPNVTLTTGKPTFDINGNLQHLNVTKGSIAIEGQGLDAGQTDALSIITRATEINAGIHAKDLNVITGANRVAADGSATSLQGEGNAPVIAVDTGALGGMYANRIHLMSSEKGVGVNLGNLNAKQGDITLDTHGKLTVKNSLASGNLTVKGESVALSGEHKASGAMSVTSQSSLAINDTQLASDGDISLSGNGKLSVTNSSITTAKNLNLTGKALSVDATSRGDAGLDIHSAISGTTNSQGKFIAGRDLAVSGGDFFNGGTLSAKGNADVMTKGSLKNQGSLLGDRDVAITTGELIQNGIISGKKSLSLEGGALSTGAGSLTTSNGTLTIKAGDAALDGNIDASGNLSIEANKLTTKSGAQLQTQSQLAIAGKQVVLDGTQAAKGAFKVSSDSLTHSGKSNAASILFDARDITNAGTLVSPSLTLNSPRLVNSGLIEGNQALNLNARELENRESGTIYSEHDLTLNLPTFKNAGLVTVGGELLLSGDLLLNSGEINAARLAARTAQIANQNSGKLLAEGQMTFTSDSLENDGQIAARSVRVNSHDVTNSGDMQGDDALSLTANSVINHGNLLTAGRLSLEGNSVSNSGVVQATSVLLKLAGQLNNAQTGIINAAKNLTLDAQAIVNEGLMMASALQVKAETVANDGSLQGLDSLSLESAALNNQSRGVLLSAGELTLNTDTLTNAGLLQGKTLNLATGEWINTGNALSEENATLTVSHTLANQGKILGQQALILSADTLDNSGWLAATTVTFYGDLVNSGLVQGDESLFIAAASLQNQDSGQLLTGGELALDGQTLVNRGVIQGNTVTLSAKDWINQGSVQAMDALTARITYSANNSGTLQSLHKFDLNAADILNSGSLAAEDLRLVSASINNGGLLQGNNSLVLDARNISNLSTGKIISGGALSLAPGAFDNAGLLQVNDDFTLTGKDFTNRGIIAANNLLLTLSGMLTNEAQGQLLARDTAHFQTESLFNRGVLAADSLELTHTRFTNSGVAQGNSVLQLETQTLDNQASGQLLSDGELALHSTASQNAGVWQGKAIHFDLASLTNTGTINGTDGVYGQVKGEFVNVSQIYSLKDIDLNAERLSNSGKIIADSLSLEAGSLSNSGLWQGTTRLDATADTLSLSQSGRMLSNGMLTLNASDLNTAGTVQGTQIIAQANSWQNSGSLLGIDSVQANIAGTLANTGDVLSQGNTQLNAQTLTNSGAILGEGDMQLKSDMLDNYGTVQGKNLSLNQGNVTNKGTLIGLNSLSLEAMPGLTLNNAGQMLAGGTLSINGGIVTNTGIWQGQRIVLNAQRLQNEGAIQSADALSLVLSDKLAAGKGSKITANGNAAIQALSLTNSGQWLAKNLTLRGNDLTNDGDISGVDGLTVALNGTFTQQQDKTLLSAGKLTLNAASVDNAGRIQATDLDIHSGAFTNSGRLQGDNALSMNLTGQLNNSAAGSILSRKILTLSTPDLLNYGLIQGGSATRVDALQTARNDGTLISGAQLTFNGASLANNGWLQASELVLNATATINNGTLFAEQQGTFNGSSLINSGTVQGSNLALNTQQLTNGGTVLGTSVLNVTANQINLQTAGKLYSGGNLLLTSVGFDQLGQVVALGNLTLKLTNAFTSKNVLAAGNTLDITSNGAITNQSVMQGQAVNLNAGGVLTNNGQLTTGNGSSTLSGSNIVLNAAGTLQAGGDVALTSRSNITVNGFTGTNGTLTLNAAGNIVNTALLYAGNNMYLLAKSIKNNRGDILAGNSLWMQRDMAGNANSEVVNTSGSIETLHGDISIKTGHLLNERDGFVAVTTENNAPQYSWVNGAEALIPLSFFNQGDYGYIINTWQSGGGSPGHGAAPSTHHSSTPVPYASQGIKEFATGSVTVSVSANGGAARIAAGRDTNINTGVLDNQASDILAARNIGLSGGSLNNQSWFSGTETRYQTYQYGYGLDQVPAPETGVSEGEITSDDIAYTATGEKRFERVNGQDYRAVIQAGGNVLANFTSDISNTSTTAHIGGISPTIHAPTLNTLSNQTIGDTTQKQNLAGAGSVEINSPQWNDQLQNALQQISGGSGLDASGASIGLVDYGGQGQGTASLSGITELKETTANGGTLQDASLNNLNPHSGNSVDTSAYPIPTGKNGYFVVSNDSTSPYLITVNPKLDSLGKLDQSLFGDLYTMMGIQPGTAPQETSSAYTDQNTFIGSSYFLERLNLHPEYDYRFLGDAAFDTRYVSNYVLNQTGSRYINGIGSDLAQMQYLIDNAAIAQKALGLQFGIALTSAQIAALDSSILWWEAATVNGQTVMIPKVYLSPKDVAVNQGSVISGENVQLAGGSVVNSGSTLTAQNDMGIYSQDSINNLNAGLISAGGDLQLSALGDINNIGSTISGKTVALESLDGSINNITLTEQWQAGGTGRGGQSVNFIDTLSGPMAGISAQDSLSLFAGQNINITGANVTAGGDLVMAAWGDIAITANQMTESAGQSGSRGRNAWSHESITSNGSTISAGGSMSMQAGHDLTVEASQLSAGDNALLIAGNNLNLNVAQTSESASKGKSENHSTDNARTTITSGGDIALVAGQDINSHAAGIAAEGDVAMQAGRDVNLLAEETTDGDSYHAKKKVVINESVRQDSTEIASGGNTTIVAGHDLNSEAAQVTASGDIGIGVGHDINLTTATESDYHFKEQTKTSSGFLSKTTTHTIEEDSATHEAGTLLSGDNVTVAAGNNLLVEGSAVVGDGDVSLNAGNNIDILAATDTDSTYRFKEKKKSGLMGSGGIGFTIGTNKSRYEMNDDGTTQSESFSTVGSTGGDVSITAGGLAHIGGADLIAGKDLSITGDRVLIEPGHDKRTHDESFEQKSSGLTIALSGAAGSAVNNAVNTAQEADKETDDRLAALKLAQATMSGVQAGQAMQLAEAGGADPSTAFGISASVGAQSSKSSSHSGQDTATGSTLTAGDSLFITATGGDITAIGSQMKSGKDVVLNAADDINLISSQNTQWLEGENKSSGGSLGVGIGVGGSGAGINISASGNSSRGHEKGNGTTQNETTLDAGGQVSLISGGDTSLAGAQVSGNKVLADIGGDLTISSLQDSDFYDSKQSSISGGASFSFGTMTGSGYINASQDKMHSNYDSVVEQSGIFAGSGGFDITVGGHTQLDGGVIGSTGSADKNRLDTGTLGFGDIGNKAEYDVSHSGVGFSSGGSIADSFISNMASTMLAGAGNSGDAKGTTQAAISAGTITIRDKEHQTQDVSDLSRDVENANGSISPIFDKEKEQKRLEIAQTIGDIGTQAADIARTAGEINGLEAARKAHPEMSTKELYDTKEFKYKQKEYGTGSDIQQGIQAATATLQGLAGNDLSAAIAGGAAPYLAEQIKKQVGEDNVAANAIAHAILGGVVAELKGQSAGAGALGAATGELIAQQLYPGMKREELTEEQKQTISGLSTLAAGLAGGLAGGNTEGAVAGAQAGKNAVENNNLGLVARGCAVAAPCRAKVAEQLLEIGTKAGIVGLAGVAIKDMADKMTSDELDHLVTLEMMGNDEITSKYIGSLQDKYGPSNTGGDQIAVQGPINTGGDQQYDQYGNPTHTGNTGRSDTSLSNTGNTDGTTDTGGNTTTTPNGEQNKDELAYLSSDSNYVPSPKHAPGGWGTPMDLSDSQAQDVLNNSIQGGKQKYGLNDGKLYEFQPDNAGGWHGYPVPGTEVPPKVLREFLDRGDISRAEYNKMIKGK